MKFTSPRCSLLLAFFMLAVNARSQCLIYNSVNKQTSSGQYSSSYSDKSSTVVGPQQNMLDGVTRSSYAYLYTYVGKFNSNGTTVTYKDFYYNERPLTNGTPSSGGLLIGLVKQGKAFKVLATAKNVFDSDTVSGTATWKNLLGYGFTYYASTLAGTSSGWGVDYNESRPIGDISSSSWNPVKVYKYTSSTTYVLNAKETSIVANMSYDQALEWKKQSLISQGYVDRIAYPYPN